MFMRLGAFMGDNVTDATRADDNDFLAHGRFFFV
jgi:hypothetical protein